MHKNTEIKVRRDYMYSQLEKDGDFNKNDPAQKKIADDAADFLVRLYSLLGYKVELIEEEE